MRVIASTPTTERGLPETPDLANRAADAAAEVRDQVDAVAERMVERVEDIDWEALWGRATGELRERALAALGWTLVIHSDTPTAEVRPADDGWVVDTEDAGEHAFSRKREATRFARDWAREHEGVMILRTADARLQQTVHYTR